MGWFSKKGKDLSEEHASVASVLETSSEAAAMVADPRMQEMLAAAEAHQPKSAELNGWQPPV